MNAAEDQRTEQIERTFFINIIFILFVRDSQNYKESKGEILYYAIIIIIIIHYVHNV